MKNFIASLKLRLSDLFLLIGFIPFAVFLIFGQLFMQFFDPNEVALPLWAALLCFVVLGVSWVIYLHLESKEGNLPKEYISWIFIILGLIGIFAIIRHPEYFKADVTLRDVTDVTRPMGYEVGDIITVSHYVSSAHYLVFIMELVATLMFIYIGLFVFPKRFTSLKFLYYLGLLVMAFMCVLILYSYITEYQNYINIFKFITGKDDSGRGIYDYAVKSFIIHRNAYGMAMMIGVIFAMINNSIKRHYVFDIFIFFFIINMLFSICKTGIVITALLVFIYYVTRFFISYKKHQKRNKIILITAISVIVPIMALFALSYLTEGKFLPQFFYVMNSLGGTRTLDTRLYIWDNTYQLLQGGKWLYGVGFGLVNMDLLQMNSVNGDFVFPTHSAYIGLLSEGGILYLLAYLALLVYVLLLVVRNFKYNPLLIITLCLGPLAFFLYSFTETIHYLVYVFLFPLMIFDNLGKKNPEELKSA